MHFTRSEIREMRNTAKNILSRYYDTYPNAMDSIDYENQDDVLYLYRGYEDDAEIVGYLSVIQEDLTNLLILRYD